MLSRADAVRTLASERFDVLVIGGGVTGAGVALDASTRGLRVGLVERADYASGTSSRSSKLVHGGLRYLLNFDLALVREALMERQLNMRLAPHLVKPLPFVVPAFGGARLDRVVGVGLNMYDALSVSRRRPPRHRRIGGAEVAELVPALAPRAPTSGYLYHDCQTDDVRLVLTILGEAERFGAVAANRVEALELLEERGRAAGARVRDAESGAEWELRAGAVVNATGVWADRLPRDGQVPVIRPSRGTHVLVAAEALPMRAGVIVPAGGGRSIFVIPWLGRVLIGTTDNDYGGELEHVRPAQDDIAYLLDAVNAFFETALGPDDVVGAYAGVRPLISTGARQSVDISRRAALFETASGMVTITGGKLTTWRRMAKQAVDRIAGDRPCRTHEIPLGAPADGVPEQLAGRYGAAAREVLELARAYPGPILEGMPDLLAEVVHAARREQARTVGDVLLRRTRLGLTAARELLASDAPERVAQVLAAEAGGEAPALAAAFRDEARAEGVLAAP